VSNILTDKAGSLSSQPCFDLVLPDGVEALDELALGFLGGDLDVLGSGLSLDPDDLGADDGDVLGLAKDVLALEQDGLDAGTEGERLGLGHGDTPEVMKRYGDRDGYVAQ